MPSSNVVWDIDGPLGTLTIARPEAKNAMTWDMYDAVVDACDLVDASDVRVLIIRGSDGAFSAGTDISQFAGLTTGEAGVAYERRIGAVIDRLERVTKVTIASIDGPAVGGGCAIAVACDLRVCAATAQFGVPVARTLGNCLSIDNLARLVDLIGPARAADMLLTDALRRTQEEQCVDFRNIDALVEQIYRKQGTHFALPQSGEGCPSVVRWRFGPNGQRRQASFRESSGHEFGVLDTHAEAECSHPVGVAMLLEQFLQHELHSHVIARVETLQFRDVVPASGPLHG